VVCFFGFGVFGLVVGGVFFGGGEVLGGAVWVGFAFLLFTFTSRFFFFFVSPPFVGSLCTIFRYPAVFAGALPFLVAPRFPS